MLFFCSIHVTMVFSFQTVFCLLVIPLTFQLQKMSTSSTHKYVKRTNRSMYRELGNIKQGPLMWNAYDSITPLFYYGIICRTDICGYISFTWLMVVLLILLLSCAYSIVNVCFIGIILSIM